MKRSAAKKNTRPSKSSAAKSGAMEVIPTTLDFEIQTCVVCGLKSVSCELRRCPAKLPASVPATTKKQKSPARSNSPNKRRR
jgi:hypothetical protein